MREKLGWHLGVLAVVLTLLTGCANNSGTVAERQEPPKPQIDESLVKAAKLLNNGLQDQAVTMINKRLEAEPDDANAYVLMGAAEVLKGDFTKAAKPYFASAVKLQPDCKKELFDFIVEFSNRRACSLRTVQMPDHKNVDPFDTGPLVSWMVDTDKAYVLKDEPLAKFALHRDLIEIEEFMKSFPQSREINGFLLMRATDEWRSDVGDEDEARRLAGQVVKRGPAGSKEVKDAQQLLRDIDRAKAREAEYRAEEAKRAREREIVGLWERLEGAFQTTMEFLDDGTWIFRVGALQEGGGYSIDGSRITMWGKSAWDGKRIAPRTGSWSVSGNRLQVSGNITASGRYRRLR